MSSAPEVAANALTAVSIFLAGRNSIHTWWTGILGCLVFAWVFVDAKLYADATLQIFFVGTSAFGWWQWRGAGEPLPVTHVRPATLAWAALVAVAAAASYGALLRYFTDAYAPFLDSTVLAFSVMAQLLLMHRRVESWQFWLLVNSIAVPLFASRGLYVTSALYALYWINAVVSWRLWARLAHAPDARLAAIAP